MAKTVITTTDFTDDLTGGKAEGTLTFAFDGQDFEIDLSAKNRRDFEKTLKPYLDNGRKIRTVKSGMRAKPVSTGVDLSAVRAWAAANGYAVAERGRVAGTVIEAFRAAGN